MTLPPSFHSQNGIGCLCHVTFIINCDLFWVLAIFKRQVMLCVRRKIAQYFSRSHWKYIRHFAMRWHGTHWLFSRKFHPQLCFSYSHPLKCAQGHTYHPTHTVEVLIHRTICSQRSLILIFICTVWNFLVSCLFPPFLYRSPHAEMNRSAVCRLSVQL